MREHRIERAEVFVVGPDVERYTWADGMTGQYMVNVVLRLTADTGLEGIAGAAMITSNGFDRSVGESLRFLLPDLMGQSSARNMPVERIHSTAKGEARHRARTMALTTRPTTK